MPLQAPQLDDRTFDQLVEEAKARIPRYTPEWTNFNEADPGITLVQPLLRNAGAKSNLSEIRVAQRDHRISVWSFRQSLINVITDTIIAYHELYFALESFKVAERSRDLAERLFSDNQKRVKSGFMAPLDIVASFVLNFVESSCIDRGVLPDFVVNPAEWNREIGRICLI